MILKCSEAFSDEPTGEAMAIIEWIKKTKEIYGYWFQGRGYDNYRVRSLLMNKQFLDYYNIAKKTVSKPKVIFKFGANHAYRGLTPVGIYDLGNTVSELAEMNETQSVHIRLAGIKGQTFNALQGIQEFNHVEDFDENLLAALGEKIYATDWILIDLKSMRQSLHHRKLKTLENGTAFSFDFLVLVPDAKPLSRFR